MYHRQINFESVFNFRDLGGYLANGGRTVAWRKIFRSAELHHMTLRDTFMMKEEIKLSAVIDLRSDFEIKQQGLGVLPEAGFKYFNVSLMPDGGDRLANERRYQGLTDMGQLYIKLAQQKEFGKRLIDALEVIAEAGNLPLIFHCSAGKDRTGILAAILLSSLGISDEDIVEDFALTGPYIERLFDDIKKYPRRMQSAKSLPDYFWKALPESMFLFLTSLEQEYGSARGYLEAQGADRLLFHRLEKALLV